MLSFIRKDDIVAVRLSGNDKKNTTKNMALLTLSNTALCTDMSESRKILSAPLNLLPISATLRFKPVASAQKQLKE